MRILQARWPRQIETARQLFEEYQAGLKLDLSFQGFQAELQGLPGQYAPPDGLLLIAYHGGVGVGCVALRSLEPGVCEMKRLYLRPEARGTGAGRRLADRVIREARRLGYVRMLLDTLPTMLGAQALYRSLGFVEVPAYRYNPVVGTLYMGLDL